MELTFFLEKKVLIFFFVFFRIMLLFFLFPLFSPTFFPRKLKILVSLVLALVLTPAVSFPLPEIKGIYDLIVVLSGEFLLIFVISLFFRFILGGIQLGGEMVGIQMGFGISQTIDPMSGFSLPVISQFVYIIFLLFFFAFNFHHYLIYFLYKSFIKIPPGSFMMSKSLAALVVKQSKMIFEISIKFLAPLLVFMLLIYVSLSIIGRLLPQINVLFVSFPLTIGLGLIFFGLMLCLLPRIIYPYYTKYFKLLVAILKYF